MKKGEFGKRIVLTAVALGWLLFFSAGAVRADELSDLKQQMETTTKMLQEMHERMAQLEARQKLKEQSMAEQIDAVVKKTEDIENVAALIEPSIRTAQNLDQAIRDNARGTSVQLKKTPLIQKMIKEKKIECRAAYYHIGSGKVDILD